MTEERRTWNDSTQYTYDPSCRHCRDKTPHHPATSPPDTLDAAWAEAEAALPEGWDGPRMMPFGTRGHVSRWAASAIAHSAAARARRPWIIDGEGPTPTAALQKLARLLKESKP